MAKLVILGAGVSGHTVASYASKWLNTKKHEVVMVSPNALWNWIPSNIWVGVGKMNKKQVTFPLAPVYKKKGITFKQAKVVSLHPEGRDGSKPFVTIEYTNDENAGTTEEVDYDFLVNGTGPKLNFGATVGLGPDAGHTVSVCTPEHAEYAFSQLNECIEKMKQGTRQTIVVGTGHGTCTCQGAAFEYTFNVEHLLREKGVRDMADIRWISNEQFVGDFGMGGVHIKSKGHLMPSKVMAESIFAERGIEWTVGAHVNKIEENKIHYELLDGSMHSQDFDFAMLLPPFAGADIKAFNASDEDITEVIFHPKNKFLKVDADYTPKPFEEWSPEDWPKTYQNQTYKNIYACGIAFAPPHPISQPKTSPNGTMITPAPPRTGMPAATMARAITYSITQMMDGKIDPETPVHSASMANMGAACLASAGKGFFNGSAVTMSVFPIVPDYKKYPHSGGRDLKYTFGEIGLGGHWVKNVLHYLFIYKAKMRPFWTLIPE